MILNNYLLFIYLFTYLFINLILCRYKNSKSNILLKIDQNTKSTKLISFHFHLPES